MHITMLLEKFLKNRVVWVWEFNVFWGFDKAKRLRVNGNTAVPTPSF